LITAGDAPIAHEVQVHELACGTSAANRRDMPNTITDITRSLDLVHGGAGKGTAIANGAKAAYNAVRPWFSRGVEAADTVGKIGGGAVVAKEAWDYFGGGGGEQKSSAPAPAAQP
jgi:hypothetical protein